MCTPGFQIQNTERYRMKLKFPIRAKAAVMIGAFSAILGVVALIICGRMLARTVDDKYIEDATNISATVAQVVDAEKVLNIKNKVAQVYNETENKISSDEWGTNEFYEYIALYTFIENEKDFKDLLSSLRSIQDVNNVDCLYLSYVDVPTESMIYLVDASEEDACPPGCFDPVYEMNRKILTDPAVGFPAYITNTEAYGWLVTAGTTIYDSEGGVIGYAMVDISMNDIRHEQTIDILKLFLYLVLATIVLVITSILLIERVLIKPLKKLSASASDYYTSDTIEHNIFSKLNIKNSDEIGALANSMKKMESDLNSQIKQLFSANTQLSISKSVANRMTELATKDPLTGIRNKTSYDFDIKTFDRQIAGGDTEFGIVMIDLNFLKFTNDTYGHENGNIALITLSDLICEVFEHSPVFRIGGDEFSVILTNSDYKNIKELEAKFNARVEQIHNDTSLLPWQRISAALGYALYDKEIDTSAKDVFNRADKNMYERKAYMKQNGAKPIQPAE